MAERDVELGSSSPVRHRQAAVESDLAATEESREAEGHQYNHPQGSPCSYGPLALIEVGTGDPQPHPFWFETARQEFELVRRRPAELDRFQLQSLEDGGAPVDDSDADAAARSPEVLPAGGGSEIAEGERPSRTRQPQLEADRTILEGMRDILQELVQQGHKTSARLDKLEEEVAMKSASSGHSGELAFHESRFRGRGAGVEARDSGIPSVLVPSVQRSSGGSIQHGCIAKGPSEMPVGATGCQYFYIGDVPAQSRGEGHEASSFPGSQGQSVAPRMKEADLLGRILKMPSDELRAVKKRFEDRALSEEATVQAWGEYFMQRDKAGSRPPSGTRDFRGGSSFEAPTLAGSGLLSVQQVDQVRMSAALTASPPPGPTGFGFQDREMGRLDHAGNRGVGEVPHLHSAPGGSQQGSHLHSGSQQGSHLHSGSQQGSHVHSGSRVSLGANGFMPEGQLGLRGLLDRGAADGAVVLSCNDSNLNAGRNGPVTQQSPVVDVPSMRACADSPGLREQYMSACAANVTSPCSPFHPLLPGNLGVWSAGDALHGQSVAPNMLPDGYPSSVAPPTLSAQGKGGDERQGRDVYSPGDKAYWELPKLPELDPSQAPLQAGDWIATITPMMADLSQNSGEYWQAIVHEASQLYQQWQVADPLTRARVVARIPPYLQDARFSRLENRALAMLLKGLPEVLREEVIASRNLSTINVIFKVYCAYQPGGLRERGMLLSYLTSPGQAATSSDAVSRLRKWFRWFDRTVQMGAALPDVSLLTQGLDQMCQQLLVTMPHVMFRLNIVRTQCAIDHNPTLSSLTTYARALQAEFEVAAVGVADSTTGGGKRQRLQAMTTGPGGNGGPPGPPKPPSNPPNPKALDGSAKGEGKGATTAAAAVGGSQQSSSSLVQPPPRKKCSFFLKENGCRLGNTCTFEHDRSLITPQNPRCFNCGALKHKKPDCEFPGGGKFASKGNGEMPQPSTKASGQGGQPSGNENASSLNNAKAPNPTPKAKAATLKPEDILANAQAMLQGLQLSGLSGPRLAVLRAYSASSTDPFANAAPSSPTVGRYGLLDGGATNPLRTGEQFELATSTVVDVSLATGEDARLWMTRTGTLLSDVQVDPIVPIGCLASELGCTVAWEGSLCRVWHPERGWLDITMVDQCPYVDRSIALALIRELELLRATRLVQAARLRILGDHRQKGFAEAWATLQGIARGGVTSGHEEDWLRGLDSAFFSVMASLFSAAPEEKVLEAIGTPSFELAGYEPPWNRRLRRSMERSKGVLVHLCSGLQDWVPRPKSDYRVLSVDFANGHDLLNHGVWSYLTRLAKLGLIRGVVGELPRPCDSKGCYAVLAMRALGLFALAQAVNGDTYIALTASDNPSTSEGDLARDDDRNPTPENLGYDCTSMRRWPIMDKLGQIATFRTAQCDQGYLGMGATESTTMEVMTTSWDLYVLLHRRVLLNRYMDRWAPGLVLAVLKTWDLWLTDTINDRRKRAYEQSVYLAEASGGGHDSMPEVRQWLVDDRGEWPTEVVPRVRPLRRTGQFRPPATPLPVPRLARVRLSEAEREYKKHVERGHFPYRSDCRECLRGAGKRRPHRHRGPTVDSYCIAADLGGPYVPALSELSPLKSMPKPRYLFVACYTFPIDERTQKFIWNDDKNTEGTGVGNVESEALIEVRAQSDGAEGSDGVRDGGAFMTRPGDFSPEEMPYEPSEADLNPEEGKPGREPSEVTEDERNLDPEAGKPGREPSEITDDEQLERDVAFRSEEPGDAVPEVCASYLREMDETTKLWKNKYADRVSGVGMRRLIFVETLSRRTKEEVSAALNRTLSKLQRWQFPMLRLHTDRGGEWINQLVRKVADNHQLSHTCTEAHDPASNGRAESSVGIIKAAIRSRLETAPGFGPKYWSLAALDAGESLLRSEMARFDSSIRPLLPWATQVCVREKKVTESHWTARFINGFIVGPSSYTPKGYTIATEPLDEPKLLVSTTIRLQRPWHALPATLPGEIWQVDPTRRVRRKSSLLEPDLKDTALDDLAVVGGEVARISEDSVRRVGPDDASDLELFPPSPSVSLAARRVCKSTQRLTLEQSEEAARALLAGSTLDRCAVAGVVYASLNRSTTSSSQRQADKDMFSQAGSWAVSLGAFCRGSFVGVISESKVRPALVRLVNRLIASFDGAHEYTAFRVTFNAASVLHRDVHNQRGSLNMVLRLSDFGGGRVFTTNGPLDFDACGRVYVDPSVPHGVEQFAGPRFVVIAYTPAFMAKLSILDVHALLSLGFNIPVSLRPLPVPSTLRPQVAGLQIRDDGSSSPVMSSGLLQLQFLVALARGGEEFVEDGERYMLHSLVWHADSKPDDTSGGSLARLAVAVVSSHENPFQVGASSPKGAAGRGWLDPYCDVSEYFSYGDDDPRPMSFRGEAEAQDLEDLMGLMACLEDITRGIQFPLVRVLKLRQLALDAEDLLEGASLSLMRTQVESALQDLGAGGIPLIGEPDPDVLLQTRQVPLAEARQHLDEWKAAISDELNALIHTHQAVKVITQKDVEALEAAGVVIQMIPGKLVLTEKPPDRRKRSRLVACGNHLPDTQPPAAGIIDPLAPADVSSSTSSTVSKAVERKELYAAGLEAEALRIQLRWAAGHRWDSRAVDVKTAFLLAPARRRNGSRVVVLIPKLVFEAELMDRGSMLLVDRALYGLAENPSDWSCFRDGTFREWHWPGPNGDLRKMKQMESDSSLWLVLAAALGADGVVEIVDSKGEILAIVGVYVDDLLLSGPTAELDAIEDALEGLWKTSAPTTVSEGLRFCGLEVNLDSDGAYLLHQTSYLKDLVGRYTLPANSTLPDFRVGYEEQEEISLPALRRSQKLVGELLWLSGKTRLDVSYTINKLGQLVSRFPRMVYEDGLRTLAYLARTSTTMLRYGAFDEPWRGENPLRYNRKKITMETWSDASFGQDDGDRSQHGVLLVLAGGVVSWHSSKQTLTAQSTAEAELIAAVEGMTLGRALGPVWMELCRESLLWSANVDNSACIQLLVVPGGAWRTRHLRLRARHFREALAEESIAVQHVPGSEMTSDVLTKSMPEGRMQLLLRLLGFVECVLGESEQQSQPQQHQGDQQLCSLASPSIADPRLASLLTLLVVASCVQPVQGTSPVGSVFGLQWEEVSLVVVLICLWEFSKWLCVVGIKRGVAAITRFVATTRNPVIPRDPRSSDPGSQTHGLPILREQRRLYGRRLEGSSFGLVEGWTEVRAPDRWRWDEDRWVLVRYHAVPQQRLYHAPADVAKKFPHL